VTPELTPLYLLANRWERQASMEVPGDRYGNGLSICARQLREIIAQLKSDAEEEQP
jgi:hypothetical protein